MFGFGSEGILEYAIVSPTVSGKSAKKTSGKSNKGTPHGKVEKNVGKSKK
jgi:hypothetical protein